MGREDGDHMGREDRTLLGRIKTHPKYARRAFVLALVITIFCAIWTVLYVLIAMGPTTGVDHPWQGVIGFAILTVTAAGVALAAARHRGSR